MSWARGKFAGSSDTSILTAPTASANPSAPPAKEIIRLSVSNWRTRRVRGAPKCLAHGDLPVPGRGAGQQQICRVGAGNQQYHAHRSQQHQKHAAAAPDDIAVERNDQHLPAPVASMFASNLSHYRVHLGACLFGAHTSPEPPNSLHVMR